MEAGETERRRDWSSSFGGGMGGVASEEEEKEEDPKSLDPFRPRVLDFDFLGGELYEEGPLAKVDDDSSGGER